MRPPAISAGYDILGVAWQIKLDYIYHNDAIYP